VPHVARFSIAPVRGLGLEHPDEIDLTETGVVEDRRFHVVDANGRQTDGLTVGRLATVHAHTDRDATMLRLGFPDGTVAEDEIRLGAPVETPIYGRTAVGHFMDGPWDAALSAYIGRTVRIVRCDRPGGTRRGNYVSLLSDGSLDRLGQQLGVGAVDARRFRMLIEVAGAEAHEEDGWIGHRIGIGDAVIRVTKPDARCAITTQDPDTGLRDLDTLRAIIAYRGLRDGTEADFGVLGDVDRPGRVRLGDEVRVLPDAAAG
jgi:uncharacterized protein YcbX